MEVRGGRKSVSCRLTLLGHSLRIDPVETSASACEDSAGVREERDQLLIPVAHLATSVPEWPVHGREIAEFLGF